MDLDFTEEQELLRETVRAVCTQYAGIDTVRAMEDDPTGFPADLWKQLAELALIGLTLPEAHGGSGQSALEAAILYEELGRALAPTPHFVSAVLAGGLLAGAGSQDQQQHWLPRLASGESIASVAWLEPEHGFGPGGVECTASGNGDRFSLSGVKWHVPFAASADVLVVPARAGSDVSLFLVDPRGAGVSVKQQFTISSDTQYAVTFDAAPAERIRASTWQDWHTVMEDGIILLAAQAIGGARRALDLTVQYALDREQFDKPLAAFQSISHYLADADTAVEGARALVYEAAWARCTGRPVTRLAPMAKLFACDTFVDVTKTAIQVWGGMGFTLEADVQLYFRRAKQLQLSWWDARYLEDLIAADVLD